MLVSNEDIIITTAKKNQDDHSNLCPSWRNNIAVLDSIMTKSHPNMALVEGGLLLDSRPSSQNQEVNGCVDSMVKRRFHTNEERRMLNVENNNTDRNNNINNMKTNDEMNSCCLRSRSESPFHEASPANRTQVNNTPLVDHQETCIEEDDENNEQDEDNTSAESRRSSSNMKGGEGASNNSHSRSLSNVIPSSSTLASFLRKLFKSYGEFCASQPWEVIVATFMFLVCILTVVSDHLASTINGKNTPPTSSTNSESPTNTLIDDEGIDIKECTTSAHSNNKHSFLSSSKSDSNNSSSWIHSIVIMAISSIAILHIVHRLKKVHQLGSGNILKIAMVYIMFTSFLFALVIWSIGLNEMDCFRQAWFFIPLLTDIEKVTRMAQFALSSFHHRRICENVANAMCVLAPALSLDTATKVLLVTVGSLTGIRELEIYSWYALVSVLVNYLVFLTFYPAGLALVLDLMYSSDSRPLWDVRHIINTLPAEEGKTPNVHRVKVTVTAVLLIIHLIHMEPLHALLSFFSLSLTYMLPSSILSFVHATHLWSHVMSVGWVWHNLERFFVIASVCVLFIKFIFYEDIDEARELRKTYVEELTRKFVIDNQIHHHKISSSNAFSSSSDQGLSHSSLTSTSRGGCDACCRRKTSCNDKIEDVAANSEDVSQPSTSGRGADGSPAITTSSPSQQHSIDRMMAYSVSTRSSMDEGISLSRLTSTSTGTTGSGRSKQGEREHIPRNSLMRFPCQTSNILCCPISLQPSSGLPPPSSRITIESNNASSSSNRILVQEVPDEDIVGIQIMQDSSSSAGSSSNTPDEDCVLNPLATAFPMPLPPSPRRSISKCVEILKKQCSDPSTCDGDTSALGGAYSLTDAEILALITAKHLRLHMLEKVMEDDLERCVRIRRTYVEQIASGREGGKLLADLPFTSYDYSRVLGACCESVVGYMTLPVGVAGPLTINGESVFVPMATTEGCLVASVNRGCTALRSNGGVRCLITSDGMSRGPIVRFPSINLMADAKKWIEDEGNFKKIKFHFDSTSRFARLKRIKVGCAGRDLYLRFIASTGDAMGMNMLTKATEHALVYLCDVIPAMQVVSLSGNFCTDKKPSAINWLEGRGKSVVCEAIVPSSVVSSVLKTTTRDLVELNKSKNLVGSALAGSIGGFNAQASNVVTAIFIATGQDAAQNVASSNCLTQMEIVPNDDVVGGGRSTKEGEDLYISVTMPSIEVGSVGGGTILKAQASCLELMGCRGASRDVPGSNARQLAIIICSTVLAGELSLMSALAAGHLVKSHLKHNRSALNILDQTSVAPNSSTCEQQQ